MKINPLYLFVFILSAGFFVSCSSDDDSSPTNGEIYGKWYADELKIEGEFTEYQEGVPIHIEFSAVSVEISDENYVVFNEDGTYTSSSGEILMEISYKMNGIPMFNDTIPMSEDFFDEGTWEKNANELSINNDSPEAATFTIEELSSTKLKLFTNSLQIDLGEELPEDADIKVSMSFVR
ncbi:MAG: lipocalin family protein [Weeksellaceae bacterium]|jgi:hypothetical protein|nr:lipocalin family protein [Weeksellaceae bacterium]